MKLAWLAALAVLPAAQGQSLQFGEPQLALRLQADGHADNAASVVRLPAGTRRMQVAELRWQADAPQQNTLRLVASAQHIDGSGSAGTLDELSLDRPLGGGYLTAGRKVMSWDVGYAFRPLDVVQQEDRRALYAPLQQGVPMLAWEAFDADRAVTLVWSNPGRQRAGQPRDDGALAMRLYRRSGARDEYAVLRLSQRNGVEAGASFAYVASEALEWHASALWQQRHEAWLVPRDAAALAPADPARWQALAGGGKALAGMTWTSEGKMSVLAEAWLDRTAYDAAQWRQWRTRNAQLLAHGPSALVFANLGWNAAALQSPDLRRQNVYLRVAQNVDTLDLALDTQWMPEDGGRITSVALTWKPAPWQLDISWRQFGGSAHAVARALPLRAAGVLALKRAF